MKVFITGGTGLIGQLLVKRLLERGDDVVVLSRNKEQAKTHFFDKTEIIEGNPSEAGQWQKAINGVDAVVNLAGESIFSKRWSSAEKAHIYESRINTTSNIVDAIDQAEKKPEVLINASAVGFYGFQNDDREINETETSGRDFLARVCVDWEDTARRAGKSGVRVAILRNGIVLAEKGGALEKMVAPFKMYSGGSIGTGKQWFPWIHIDDTIGLILFALDNKDVSGVMNATSPNPLQMKDFSAIIGKIVKRPVWLPVPTPALKVALGEAAEVLASGQRAMPKKALEKGYEFEFKDAETALKNLLE